MTHRILICFFLLHNQHTNIDYHCRGQAIHAYCELNFHKYEYDVSENSIKHSSFIVAGYSNFIIKSHSWFVLWLRNFKMRIFI